VASTIVHESETIRIGAFRSRPSDADFGDSGPTRGHLLVFPREAVVIQHAGGPPIVANPNVVMIYNRGQEYTRRAISTVGDRCEWFAYSADAIIEAHRAAGARVTDHSRPFGALTHAACTPRNYLLARFAFENRGGDLLFVEEVASTLLADVVRAHRPAARSAAISPAHAELADAVRHDVAARFTEPLSLGAIARSHGVSAFHLARVFRRATGQSIHAYRVALRLRAAIERIADHEDVSTVALAVGFSSHSHFTSAFRRAFGVTPSQLRSSKILTAARQLCAR
jgi:AraC-like DNA-binding protein